ncbi:sensor histidine kinase [Vibrio anguillarum]|uniref:sensor histidine kinase n=1 Tax=Vibrio anguillarum TaxID=55601 RepID=UPI00097E173E|nr:sensor histidine kinase [Vibrio anguillarum]AQM20871.1 histidine kinase [Vibrio anguillarum]AUB85886.1 histidine kinase [Vibrio anguillarum]AUB89324.1 histidine kinase [Vibrio anguillarum]AUB92765.1 histidine kinase [Vibrio anguillarum]AUB96198.1 histidine kinase [Vibrio anguillarum]
MAYSTSSFQTRARTIDHLGREQIADIPTAISELWKNAYDAYAKNVSLNIFDGELPVATLVDDGHGMTIDDVNNKWLTVGTDSKVTASQISESDRNGLDIRVRQGQKGIGRLSCAALGSLTLLISKKKNEPFVACLLDWRLFENPYLMLHDIKLPVADFTIHSELNSMLPDMFDALMGNIWGDGEDKARDARIKAAWDTFELLELEDKKDSTKLLIEKTVIGTCFTDKHFETWDVWNKRSEHGTAMFIGNIHDDLIAQLSFDSGSEADGTEVRAKERFVQTLNSFVNPFVRDEKDLITDFSTSVIAWNGSLQRFVIDKVRNFDISNFDQLEHIVEGNINENGLFEGRVKAFGEWHEDVIIRPKSKYKTRKDSRFGPFSLRLGTFEVMKKNTSLSEELYEKFYTARETIGGVMVFRDNLRVMPYGREDNDFFEMEKRRSNNAGRYVFSNRACFGGVQITKENNPNLKDKAGREGIIDNKASKLFREIVEHILVEVALKFIGRESSIRTEKLEELNAIHAANKVEEDRKKILRKEQKRIKSSITKNKPFLDDLLDELESTAEILKNEEDINDQERLLNLKRSINELDGKLKGFSLSPIPRTLGSVESQYREYRDIELTSKQILKNINDSINSALNKLIIKEDTEIAEKELQSKAGILHSKIKNLANEGRKLLKQEQESFEQEIDYLNKSFHNKLKTHIDQLAAKRTSLDEVLKTIDIEYQLHDIEISQKLSPHIKAIESLKERIDMEGLTIQSINENFALKKQVEQVNSLAQLGITVEIIGHEIEGFDMTIERGLNNLKSSGLNQTQEKYLDNAIQAHQSLSDSWRFLSPLKLSGEKVRTLISGDDIYNYVCNFFKNKLEMNKISFIQSESFKSISLYEQPSKIFPVFINLVNNSRYWVKETEVDRTIRFDFVDGLVYVSDNGPGVDIDDIDSLFSIFFTKKQRGGRGVGLYLCKQNLSSGGHQIFYEKESNKKILSGANFGIMFKGIKHVG